MRRSLIGLLASVVLVIAAGFGCTNSDPLNPETAAIQFDLEPENQSGLCCVQTSLNAFTVRRVSDEEELAVIPVPLTSFDLAGVGRCVGEGTATEFEVRLAAGTWDLVSFTLQGLRTRPSVSASECGPLSVCSFAETNLSDLYPVPPRIVVGVGSEAPVRIRVDAGLLATCMNGMSQEDLEDLLRDAIRFE